MAKVYGASSNKKIVYWRWDSTNNNWKEYTEELDSGNEGRSYVSVERHVPDFEGMGYLFYDTAGDKLYADVSHGYTHVSLGNHAAGQEADKFTTETSLTGAELFAFKLANNLTSGVTTVDQIRFQLSGVSGIAQTDFANLAIYVDANNDGTIGGGRPPQWAAPAW